MYNVRNNLALSMFKIYSNPFQMCIPLITGQQLPIFIKMQSRLETRKSSLFRFGTRLWNNAPSVLKDLNKNSFKKKLHSMLIKILEKEDQYLEPELIVKQMSKF